MLYSRLLPSGKIWVTDSGHFKFECKLLMYLVSADSVFAESCLRNDKPKFLRDKMTIHAIN